MLAWDDSLPLSPTRILVAGPSGVGKTSLCARISALTGIKHTEIDSLFHGPNWTPLPDFEAKVGAFTAEEAWLTEWQYSPVRPLLASRAQLLVWLDLPFWRVTLPQVVRRTWSRRRHREPLWNGNTEGPLWAFFTDPEHIVRWSIKTRNLYRERVPALEARYSGLTVVRLRSRKELDAWVARTFVADSAHGGA